MTPTRPPSTRAGPQQAPRREEPAREVRLRCADGAWRWFDVSRAPLGGGGDVLLLHDAANRRARLERSQERFRLMAEHGQDVLVVVERNGIVRWVSAAARRHLGHDPDAAVGTDALDLVHPDDRERAVADLARLASGETMTVPTVVRVRRGDGGWEQVEVTAADLLDEPAVAGILLHMRIVTERVEAEERLRGAAREMARLTRVLGATSDLVAITSRAGRLLYVNEAFCEFFGVDRGHLAAFDFAEVTPEWAQERYRTDAIPALRDDGLWQGEFAYFRGDREVPMSALFIAHRDEHDKLEFVSSITRDISDRKALEARLAHQATHDALTDLPNRALFLDHLDIALARAERTGATIAVLFLDLDDFKRVNDTHGHRYGDEVLVAAGQRLVTAVRPTDTVARFGGDEFVIVCDELPSEAEALELAERVARALRESLAIDGDEVTVTASIGLALAVGGGDGAELLRAADVAMYEAKQAGRDRVAVAAQSA